MKHEIINHEDNLYKVLRRIRASNKPIIQTWKDHLRADLVLSGSDGFFWFLELVPDTAFEELAA